jgi:hypothetical protein
MSKFTKIAAGTLAALTITVGALATSSTEAHAWGKKGIGFGIAAGVLGAAAFAAATAPSYGYAPVSCRLVDRYDAWNRYVGTQKICRTHY